MMMISFSSTFNLFRARRTEEPSDGAHYALHFLNILAPCMCIHILYIWIKRRAYETWKQKSIEWKILWRYIIEKKSKKKQQKSRKRKRQKREFSRHSEVNCDFLYLVPEDCLRAGLAGTAEGRRKNSEKLLDLSSKTMRWRKSHYEIWVSKKIMFNIIAKQTTAEDGKGEEEEDFVSKTNHISRSTEQKYQENFSPSSANIFRKPLLLCMRGFWNQENATNKTGDL